MMSNIYLIVVAVYMIATTDSLLGWASGNPDGVLSTVIPLTNFPVIREIERVVILVESLFKGINALMLIFFFIVITCGDHSKVKILTATMFNIDADNMSIADTTLIDSVGKICDGVFPLTFILFAVSLVIGIIVIL